MQAVIRLVSPGSLDPALFDMGLYVRFQKHLGTAYYNRGRHIEAINAWKELLTHAPETFNRCQLSLRQIREGLYLGPRDARRALPTPYPTQPLSGNVGGRVFPAYL